MASTNLKKSVHYRGEGGGTCEEVSVARQKSIFLQSIDQVQELLSSHASPRDAWESRVVGKLDGHNGVHIEP